jgi:AraC-like DNA-binding protein
MGTTASKRRSVHVATALIDPDVATGDSALGRWTSAHWSPPAASPLLGVVDRIWYFDGTLALARERVFPDGTAEIVVQLDEPHRDGDLSLPVHFPVICVSGLRTTPSVVVAPAGRCRVAGIRLRAPAASCALGLPVAELLDITADLHAVAGRAARQLGQRCFEAAETAHGSAARRAVSVVRAAAGWTIARLGNTRSDELVARVARAVVRERGDVRIETLRAESGLSRPELARRFRRELGIAPKRFARIVRFNHVLRALARRETSSAAAADLGYFDQAHLYRDFEEFARMTPGAFLAATLYAGSVSIAEP